MSLRASDPNLEVSFMPSCEHGVDRPTVVYAKPLRGVQFVEYQDSLLSADRRGVIRSTSADAHKSLIKKTVTKITNVVTADGLYHEELSGHDDCVNFLTTLEDVDAYNEIIAFLQGTARLTEDEEKNSQERLIATPSKSPLPAEPGT